MVRKISRRGRTVFVIDFRHPKAPGGRYRRDAQGVTQRAAELEERAILAGLEEHGRLMTPEAPVVAPEVIEPPAPAPKSDVRTLAEFWTSHYEPLVLPAFTEGTRKTYESLWKRRANGLRVLLGAEPLTMGNEKIFAARNAILANHRSPRLQMIMLKALFKSAAEFELMAPRTMPEGLYEEPEKLPESIEPEVAAHILATAKGWLKRALVLSLHCGLRMGEMRAVRRKDVDLVRRLVFVRQAYSEQKLSLVKTKRQRAVPLNDEAWSILSESLGDWEHGDDALVCGKGPTSTMPYRRSGVWTAFQVHLGRLGLEGRAYHLTRHFFCTELVAGGVDVETARSLSGHKSMRAFERYSHTVDQRRRDAVARLALGNKGLLGNGTDRSVG